MKGDETMASSQKSFSMSGETHSRLKRIARHATYSSGFDVSVAKIVTMLINKYFEAHAAEIESFEAAEVRSDRN